MSKRFIAALVIIGLIALGVGVFSAGSLQAKVHQPHMEAALDHLEKAKAQLDKAAGNKGGHRAKAMELINAAIAEVHKGMEFDDREPGPGPRRR